MSFTGPHITEGELEAYQYKTDRYLRLRELLLDHSSDSNLVVMWVAKKMLTYFFSNQAMLTLK
jgi:hypothetical protein